LRTAEVEYFIPLLRDLNQALLPRQRPTTNSCGDAVGGRGAAHRRLRLRRGATARSGLRGPSYAQDLVDPSLANIEERCRHDALAIFPDLPFGEDYTQYIPRGHYTRSDALKRLFQEHDVVRAHDLPREPGMSPRSAVPRRVPRSFSSTPCAAQRPPGVPALDVWDELYNPTVFFVGRSDDLIVHQYLAVMDEVYGEGVSANGLVDEAKLDAFIEMADQLPPP
jgi:hypothetical protein